MIRCLGARLAFRRNMSMEKEVGKREGRTKEDSGRLKGKSDSGDTKDGKMDGCKEE